MGSPVETYQRSAASVAGAKVTAAVTSRSPAPATATAVRTWWLRPERRRSIASASSGAAGLPSTAPPSTTLVSAARTVASS